MYYFVSPKNFRKIYSFLEFPGGKTLNIGLIRVNYALKPVKPEQGRPKLTECFWALRRW